MASKQKLHCPSGKLVEAREVFGFMHFKRPTADEIHAELVAMPGDNKWCPNPRFSAGALWIKNSDLKDVWLHAAVAVVGAGNTS